MDAAVFTEGAGVWHVNASPSMRSLGEVLKRPDNTFSVLPDDGGSLLEGIGIGPYPSLQDAMEAISRHLGGSCRLVSRKRI
jgi:hypothetical protein